MLAQLILVKINEILSKILSILFDTRLVHLIKIILIPPLFWKDGKELEIQYSTIHNENYWYLSQIFKELGVGVSICLMYKCHSIR